MELVLGGLEPPTSALWEPRSNQLSYSTTNTVRKGFEPLVRLLVRLVSSELISATHPPHHWLTSIITYLCSNINTFLSNMSHFLGQCFLINEESINKINETIELNYQNQQLYEIGPWPWIMTQFMSKLSDNLIVHELDKSFEKKLLSFVCPEQIIRWDVLQTRRKPANKSLVYGSLPYYITSPILRLICDWVYVTWIFVIQHEVGEKIASIAKKKSFLWWLLNYYYDCDYVLKIPSNHFNPAPKVDSCCVVLTPRDKPVWSQNDFNQLIKLLDTINWFKRKTLWAVAKMINNAQMLESLQKMWINWKRLEELDWTEMMILVKNSWS